MAILMDDYIGRYCTSVHKHGGCITFHPNYGHLTDHLPGGTCHQIITGKISLVITVPAILICQRLVRDQVRLMGGAYLIIMADTCKIIIAHHRVVLIFQDPGMLCQIAFQGPLHTAFLVNLCMKIALKIHGEIAVIADMLMTDM